MKLECYGRVYPLAAKQQADGRSKTTVFKKKKKLKRDESFHRKNREFMENLIQKGYARKMTEEEAMRRSQRTWYSPHHGVSPPKAGQNSCSI